MVAINFFGVTDAIEKYTNAVKEKMSDNDPDVTVPTSVLVVTITILVGLTIWAIYVLATFKLPQNILAISIILLILTGPVIPLILAYVFKGKA